MMRSFSIPLIASSAFARAAFIVLVCLLIAFPLHQANAQFNPLPQPQFALCQDESGAAVQGLTVSIIYCVRERIIDAVNGKNGQPGYIAKVTTLMKPFMWAAITLAITLYGVKLVNMGVQKFQKETFELAFRIAIVLYLVSNAGSFFLQAGSIMGELIALVSGGLNTLLQGGATVCSTSPLPALPAGSMQDEYIVWEYFDCIFRTLLGAVNVSNALGGLVIVLAASLFAGAWGIAIIMIGITAVIALMLSMFRSIYIYLLSFIMIGLLMTLTPMMAPLLVFDNGYTREMFWKWVEMIVATLFEPMIITGFLLFSIFVQNQFVNGESTVFPNCVPETFSMGGTVTTDNNSGLCSFKQIFDAANPADHLDKNTSLFEHSIVGQQAAAQLECNGDWGCQAQNTVATGVANAKNAAANAIQQVSDFASKFVIHVTALFNFPYKSMLKTLVCFLIVVIACRKVVDVAPEMARAITGMAGLAISEVAQVPFEAATARAVKAGGTAANAKTRNKRGVKNQAQGIGAGLSAAGESVLQSFRRT